MEPTIFEKYQPAARIIEESLERTRHACFWIEDVEATAGRYPRLTGISSRTT